MAVIAEHIKKSEYKILGNVNFSDGSPNRAVLVIISLLDPLTATDSLRGATEIVRTTTDQYGTYTIQTNWVPGDYVVKYYGTGKSPINQSSIDWDFFTINYVGSFDLEAPYNTKIYKVH